MYVVMITNLLERARYYEASKNSNQSATNRHGAKSLQSTNTLQSAPTSREAGIHARDRVVFQHAGYQHGLQLILGCLDDGVIDVDTLVREKGSVVGQIVVLQGEVSHSGGESVVI